MNTHLKYCYACGNTPILGILITSERPQENCLNNHSFKLSILPYMNPGVVPLSHLSGKDHRQPCLSLTRESTPARPTLHTGDASPEGLRTPRTHPHKATMLQQLLEFFKNHFLSQFMSFTGKSVLLLYNYTFFSFVVGLSNLITHLIYHPWL